MQRAPLTISRPELLINGSDMQFRRLIDALFAFSARHTTIRDGHAARIGLTGVEYTFLVSVRHLQDSSHVSVTLLAEHLHLSGTFCTTVLGKLIKKGYVRKQADPLDGRKVRLEVTDKGTELLAELAPVQRQVNDLQFGCLSRENFLILCEILEQLIGCADRAIALQHYFQSTRQSS